MSFDEILIKSVRKRESIWNIKSQAYRRKDLKEEKWAEISRELHTPVEQCKTRFKSLRDRYARELKKKGTPSSGPEDDVDEWQYFSQLDFLRSALRKKNPLFGKTQFVITPKSEPTEDSWDQHELPIPMSPENDLTNPLETAEEPNIPDLHGTMETNEKFNAFVDNANAFMATNMKKSPTHPFFSYLEEKMRHLPPQVKDSLELEFLTRVHEELKKHNGY